MSNTFKRKEQLNQAQPGEWVPWIDQYNRQTAALVCPVCSRALMVSLDIHTIDEQGYLIPSWVCTHLNCTFHTMIKLDDWFV